MPPTSKKLKGHIGLGLSVCPVQSSPVRELRLALGQERLELGSCNLVCGLYIKLRGPVFFSFRYIQGARGNSVRICIVYENSSMIK